jgi:hypothetical protein
MMNLTPSTPTLKFSALRGKKDTTDRRINGNFNVEKSSIESMDSTQPSLFDLNTVTWRADSSTDFGSSNNSDAVWGVTPCAMHMRSNRLAAVPLLSD